MPAWAAGSMTAQPSELRLQKQEAKAASRPQLDFAEPSSANFDFISQVRSNRIHAVLAGTNLQAMCMPVT